MAMNDGLQLTDPSDFGGTYVDNGHIVHYNVHIAGSAGGSIVDPGLPRRGLQLACVAEEDGITQLIGPLAFEVDENAGYFLDCEVRAVTDASSAAALFIGFTDQNAAGEVPIEDEDGTLQTNATNAVGFMMERQQEATGPAVRGNADTDGAQTALTGANDISNNVWQRLRLTNNNSDGDFTFEIWDIDSDEHYTYAGNGVLHTRSSAVATGTVLAPTFCLDSRNAVVAVQIRKLTAGTN